MAFAPLDIRTLVYVATIGSMLLAAGMLIVRRIAPGEPGVREWSWAALFATIGYLFAALRGALPELFTVVVPVACLTASYMRLHQGARAFVGKGPHRAWEFAAVAIATIAVGWYTVFEPSVRARVVAASSVTGVAVIATWVTLRFAPRIKSRVIQMLVADAFLVWGLTNVAQVVASYYWSPTRSFFEGGGPLRGWGQLFHIAFQTCLALGLPLLVMARLRERQQEADEALRRHEEELSALVTERTAEVRRQRQEIEDLYNHAPCGYHSIDADGTIVAINDTELRMLGYHRHEVEGRLNIRDVIAPEDVARFEAPFVELQKGRSLGEFEFEYLRKDGSRIPVLVHANAVYGPDGRFLRSRTVVIDDTEHAQMQRELALMNAELEKSNAGLEKANAELGTANARLENANAELEQRVRERTERLRELSRDITLAEERERRALARDLHDDLGQLLHVAKINVDALARLSARDEAASELSRKLDRLIQDASARVRSVTAQLSPPVLERLGLVAALRWLAEEMERTYGLVVEVEEDDRPKPLTQAQSVILFRAARELLINVAKHADSTIARVDVGVDDDALTVRVVDEGSGIDGTAPGDGFGLESVRERIGYLEGSVEIDSAPSEGTTVTLRLPLYSPASEGAEER